jgi:hypothetical protein
MEKSGMVMRHLKDINSRHYNLDDYHLEKGSNLKNRTLIGIMDCHGHTPSQ